MKRLSQCVLCLTLCFCLCFAGSMTVFASESDQSEMSMEDLLDLLKALTGESGEDEADTNEVVAEFAEYTLGDVTFQMPANWEAEESSEGFSFVADDFSVFGSAICADNDDGVDILSEESFKELIESIGGEEAVRNARQVSICGYPAIWLEAAIDSSGITADSYMILFQTEKASFFIDFTALSGDHYEEFVHTVQSITIDGADGETDISAAYDGELPPVNTFPVKPDASDDVDDAKLDVTTPVHTDTKPDADAPADAVGIDASETGEITLVDNDACTIIMKDFAVEEFYPFKAVISTDNKSDLNLYVSLDDVSVNGYMCDPWFGKTISAGHQSNDDMSFYSGDFDINGIEQVRDFEFTLVVRDDDDYFADPIVNETFVIYPFGPDVPVQPPQEFDDDDIVLIDNDDYTMIITGFESDDYFFAANVYLENNSDMPLDFNIGGSSAVNGTELNPYFYESIQPGKKSNSPIRWFTSELEENGIETVEELELEISVKETDDWFGDPLFTDTITVQVK